MNFPQSDKRTKQNLIEHMKMLAASFTPEWKFDEERPDIGSCAAVIYADMMLDEIHRFNHSTEKHAIEFFSRLGASPLPSEPSEGYAVFGMSGSESQVSGEYVRKGFRLNAVSDGENEIFTVTEPLYVLNAEIKGVFEDNAKADSVIRRYGIEDGAFKAVPVFCADGGNLQEHYLYFACPADIRNSAGAQFYMEFIFDNLSEEIAEMFLKDLANGNGLNLSYSTEEGYQRVKDCRLKNNILFFCLSPEYRAAQVTEGDQPEMYFRLMFENCSYESVYIKDIKVGASEKKMMPDGIYDDMGQLETEQFMPYGMNPVPYTSVYVASGDAFGKAGAEIELSFSVRYQKIRINEIQNDQIDWKYVMKRSKVKKPVEYEVRIAEVTWEYYNGYGWVKLFPGKEYAGVFDGTNNGDEVVMHFECPSDIRQVFTAGGNVYAIRARAVSVENFAAQNGWYVIPVVSIPRVSYCYRRLISSARYITQNNMEQRVYGQNRDSFRAVYGIKGEGSNINFAFSVPPCQGNINILFSMRENKISQDREFTWEYYAKSGWKKLPCRDNTKGLCTTGILTIFACGDFKEETLYKTKGYWIRCRVLNSGIGNANIMDGMYLNAVKIKNTENRDFEYFHISKDGQRQCRLRNPGVYRADVYVDEKKETSEITAASLISKGIAEPEYDEEGKIYRLWVKWNETADIADCSAGERAYQLNRETGEIRFGNGTNGRIPNVSDHANVKVKYSTGKGKTGNLPAGSIRSGENTIGLISDITNPMPITGGLDRENTKTTMHRFSAELRSGNRACTEFDFENIMKNLNRNVMRVKVIGGVNAELKKEYGSVTAVVLFSDAGEFFEKSQILKQKTLKVCCANIEKDRFYLIQPYRVNYRICIRIRLKDNEHNADLSEAVKIKIRDLFSDEEKVPRIGFLPDKNLIIGAVSEMTEVIAVDNLTVRYFDENNREISEVMIESRKEIAVAFPQNTDVVTEAKRGDV